MTVSNEFIQAVREKKILRIRIMLKDSLLVDSSFNTYDEMRKYAETNGVSLWKENKLLLKKKNSWTIDDMNYELTALVNDFTQEHVSYVKEIIENVCPSPAPQLKGSSDSSVPSISRKVQHTSEYLYSVITDSINSLTDSINSCSRLFQKHNEKKFWTKKEIEIIKYLAQEILGACDELLDKW